MKLFKKLSLLLALFFINGYVFGQNLVVNGDFESGNTGFTSDYTYQPGINANTLAAEYTIVEDPSTWNTAFNNSFGDNTSGSGNMMVANGAPSLDIVWEQTIAVTPGTTYDFAAYITSVVALSPATLQFSVNGSPIGNLNADMDVGEWDLFFATWNSGAATSAEIQIVNTNTTASGNDFALDDIYFGSTIFSADLPTMSQWTLVLFGLIVCTLGVVMFYNVRTPSSAK